MPDSNADQDFREPSPYRPPYLRQLAIQGTAFFLILSLAWPYYVIRGETLPWSEVSLVVGGTALLLTVLMKQPWWWWLIHGLFVPSVCLFSTFSIPPSGYLFVFLFLFLLYRGALSGQIPLFLSNTQTCAAVARLLSDKPQIKIMDIGAGTGNFVRHLARELKTAQISGAENAFIPWLLGYLLMRRLRNTQWLMIDFWKISLTDYDVVYAFLSPAPMSDLWKKVQSEMCPGSLFISNSFPVPGQDASFLVEVDDARKTLLFCYEIGVPVG